MYIPKCQSICVVSKNVTVLVSVTLYFGANLAGRSSVVSKTESKVEFYIANICLPSLLVVNSSSYSRFTCNVRLSVCQLHVVYIHI